MFISILNFWVVLLFITTILGIYLFFYFNIFGGFAELKWKFYYFFFSWFLTFCYLFLEVDIILQQFSFQLGDLLIIKDWQDLITISLDLSFWLSCWFILPLLLFYSWSFFFNIWTLQEKRSWGIFFIIIFYFFYLFKFLLDYDLFLACWALIKEMPQTFYDFQPDFLYIILTYLGDFNDLSKFFGLLLICFFLLFLFQGNIIIHLKNIYFRGLFSFCFSGILFYFFGGESVWRDCFLFLNTIVFCEIYYFSYLFFFVLKHKIFI